MNADDIARLYYRIDELERAVKAWKKKYQDQVDDTAELYKRYIDALDKVPANE